MSTYNTDIFSLLKLVSQVGWEIATLGSGRVPEETLWDQAAATGAPRGPTRSNTHVTHPLANQVTGADRSLGGSFSWNLKDLGELN